MKEARLKLRAGLFYVLFRLLWRSVDLAVAKSRDHIMQLFIGDEAAAMCEFVTVDGFGQLCGFRIGVGARVLKLAPFGQSGRTLSSGLTTTILETEGLLSRLVQGSGVHYDRVRSG